jgi:hypothetical protein
MGKKTKAGSKYFDTGYRAKAVRLTKNKELWKSA